MPLPAPSQQVSLLLQEPLLSLELPSDLPWPLRAFFSQLPFEFSFLVAAGGENFTSAVLSLNNGCVSAIRVSARAAMPNPIEPADDRSALQL